MSEPTATSTPRTRQPRTAYRKTILFLRSLIVGIILLTIGFLIYTQVMSITTTTGYAETFAQVSTSQLAPGDPLSALSKQVTPITKVNANGERFSVMPYSDGYDLILVYAFNADASQPVGQDQIFAIMWTGGEAFKDPKAHSDWVFCDTDLLAQCADLYQ